MTTMRELEKTKNISVATVLVMLLMIIALLTYKKPVHAYTKAVDTALMDMRSSDYLLSQTDVDENSFLIDVRTSFEYSKGHLPDAINIPLTDLLIDQNIERIKDAVANSKSIVFYSSDVDEALSAKMLIDQLGYAKSNLLAVSLSYDQENLIVKDVEVERTPEDIRAFINKSIKEAEAKKVVKRKPVPKKVIPKKKKKKMPVEGGC